MSDEPLTVPDPLSIHALILTYFPLYVYPLHSSEETLNELTNLSLPSFKFI